jgi:hypothetical protein
LKTNVSVHFCHKKQHFESNSTFENDNIDTQEDIASIKADEMMSGNKKEALHIKEEFAADLKMGQDETVQLANFLELGM